MISPITHSIPGRPKTIKIGYRRLDGDLPYDVRVFDKAKTLTIGGKP